LSVDEEMGRPERREKARKRAAENSLKMEQFFGKSGKPEGMTPCSL